MKTLAELVLLPRPRCVRSDAGRARATAAVTVLDRQCGLAAQGYRLRIAPAGITVTAPDEAGLFYGQMTLRQIARQCGEWLPGGEIEDWPDFPTRGVMLDISRDKVPTLATLLALVDELAEWKINHLELYTEHTFAYRNHRAVWEQASPLTGEEIRQLDAYCRARHVELAPNQNSFGHMERWLKHPAYQALASGTQRSCLDPQNPASVELLAELYAELLPNFTSRKFNVGCDETYGIGGRVYWEFLKQIHRLVTAHGCTMHFWGDIIVNHPELVAELPRDVVVLEWGYEAGHKFDDHLALFAKSGLPFYVCPGTSSWNSIAGRTENCLGNLRNAAASGRRHGAIGFLNTDWGDNGHWQYLPVSYLGFAAGAALSWCYDANQRDDFMAALDTHVFRDSARVMGRLAYDLGNAYRQCGKEVGNATALFFLLQRDPAETLPGLAAARDYIQRVMAPLTQARMERPDAALIADEFANAARLLIHACDRGLGAPRAELAGQMRAIIAEHRRLWLARNRPGGLADSVGRMEVRLREYEA